MKNLITLCFVLLNLLSTLAAHSDTDKDVDIYSTKVREKISNAWLNQKPGNIKAVQESKELITVKFVFEIKKRWLSPKFENYRKFKNKRT